MLIADVASASTAAPIAAELPTRKLPNIESGKKIAERAQLVRVQPAPPPVFRRVMDHMAPLAERREIARPVARRIMVQVRARDRDARRSH